MRLVVPSGESTASRRAPCETRQRDSPRSAAAESSRARGPPRPHTAVSRTVLPLPAFAPFRSRTAHLNPSVIEKSGSTVSNSVLQAERQGPPAPPALCSPAPPHLSRPPGPLASPPAAAASSVCLRVSGHMTVRLGFCPDPVDIVWGVPTCGAATSRSPRVPRAPFPSRRASGPLVGPLGADCSDHVGPVASRDRSPLL